jgi:TonB family protein
MTVPVKEPRPTPKPATPPKSAPTEATGRTPTKGADVRPGNALIETGARGIGLGLSTGDGGGTGGEIDLGSFCCPEYLTTLIDLVQRNWNSKQQVSGAATVKFTIARDGTISDVEVARSSGYAVLDLTAQRAILSTRLPPLPRAYTNPDLTVHLNFQYQH